MRARDSNFFLLSLADSRSNILFFLFAKETTLTRMGIESCDAYPRAGDGEKAPKAAVRQEDGPAYLIYRERPRHVFQGDVTRDEADAQTFRDEHHRVLFRPRPRGEVFGVAVKDRRSSLVGRRSC